MSSSSSFAPPPVEEQPVHPSPTAGQPLFARSMGAADLAVDKDMESRNPPSANGFEPAGAATSRVVLMPPFAAQQTSHVSTLNDFYSFQSAIQPPTTIHSHYRPQGMPLTATHSRRLSEHSSPRANTTIAPKYSSSQPIPDANLGTNSIAAAPATHSHSQPLGQSTSSKIETPVLSLPQPQSHSPDPPSISRLSSPFPDRPGPMGSQFDSPRTPSPIENHPNLLDDIFSTPVSTTMPSGLTILATPIPTRPVGGEIDRIRMHLAGLEAVHVHEKEARRPDYLRRVKRANSMDIDHGILQDVDSDELPLLGITDSPQKGRRLQLFQETSEESFEQSLTIDGYRSYGSCPAYNEPMGSGPVVAPSTGFGAGIPNSLPHTLTQSAHDWFPQNTPKASTVGKLQVADGDEELDEKELRKRKRLAAFTDSGPTSGGTRLYAVEIEGKGRCLSDIPADQLSETLEQTPTKKRRGNGRGRKAQVSHAPLVSPSKKTIGQRPMSDVHRPNWLDKEFPWSLRQEERRDQEKEETEARMRWIEKFLERDSEESDMEEELEVLPSTSIGQIYEDPPAPARWGRGKAVSLKADPEGRPHPQRQKLTVVFPSDPADARAALMSKKSIRALAFARQGLFLEEQSDEEQVLCVCNGRDDGRDLVQCDDCQTWYHLQCLGIRDIAELGEEDDPWYCRNCEGAHESFEANRPPEVRPEPTLVPTDDQPSAKKRQDTFLFHPVQNSPIQTWSSPRLQTPSRRKNPPTRSHILGESLTPQGSTFRGTKLFSTPGPPGQMYDEYADFDPMSTPSGGRGLFDGPFTTPKSSSWSARAGSLFQTPIQTSRRSLGSIGSVGGLSWTPSGGEFTGSSPRIVHTQFLDSPIRRKSGSSTAGKRLNALDLAALPLSPTTPTPRARPRPLTPDASME